ncbi:putative membrane protein [Corynebacterium simulans]|nr:putative membrane protein [Corynebacterium simulans]
MWTRKHFIRKVLSMKLSSSFAMLAARVILGVILIAHG